MEKLDPLRANYLIDIDTIFDTRLGTVALLGDEHLDKLHELGYDTREDDSLLHAIPGYTELWANRDISVLGKSTVSKMFTIIVGLIIGDLNDFDTPITGRKFNLYVNSYPYKLNEDEKQDIIAVLGQAFQWRVAVEIRHYSPEQLSPRTVLSNNFWMMGMYDFEKWIKIHFETLYKTPLPETVLITPALRELNARTLPEIDSETTKILEKITPFECVELDLLEVLALKYYEVSHYCSYLYFQKPAKKEG